MTDEIFEFRRQARGPGNYMALGVCMAVMWAGWSQGWGLVAAFLCGPFLAMIIVRLIVNDAQGFRLDQEGLSWHDGFAGQAFDWHDIDAVTLSGNGQGGAECRLHLAGGTSYLIPAAAAFAPERLALEFRLRGVPVWRPEPEKNRMPTMAQLQ